MYEPVRSLEEACRIADDYFMGKSAVHQTATSLAALLSKEDIDFAIAGALALNEHGVFRGTEDVDILITRDGLRRFKDRWLGRGYVELRPGGKPVRDTQTQVKIDFLISGDFPGDGKPKPVAFPVPADASQKTSDFPVVSLPRFIELKLASAMTAPDRPRDFDDVIRLVRARQLPAELERELDPYVRAEYARLWAIAQAPVDEY